ncbi:hypothetical protein [Herpetosiphon giganteus]|uniref:hypothetical protein n=1 Tax=Herpetosiphon giganteus TaxID=2029754 RepID=UPI00195EE6FA|nr:hypothetical protein [Herpetosiphon giganteus]MBM7844252.1 hypothetical protein [Herpetosiphon giganteus]
MFNAQQRTVLERQAVRLFCQHVENFWHDFVPPQGYGILDGDSLQPPQFPAIRRNSMAIEAHPSDQQSFFVVCQRRDAINGKWYRLQRLFNYQILANLAVS